MSLQTDTISEKIQIYKSEIKKIQSDLDYNSNCLETCEPGTSKYSTYHGQQWSLSQVLASKQRMLKKYLKAAKDMGIEI